MSDYECPECGTDRVRTFDTGDGVCVNNHNFDLPGAGDGEWIVVYDGDDFSTAVPADQSAVRECTPDDGSVKNDGFIVYTDAGGDACHGSLSTLRWDVRDGVGDTHDTAHDDPPHGLAWYFGRSAYDYKTLTDAELQQEVDGR